MRSLRGPAIALAAMALAALVGSSERMASWTMTDRYYARVDYACRKGRIAPFPGKACGTDWIAALRYEVARVRHRLSRGADTGLACGAEASVYRTAAEQSLWGLGPPPDPGKTLVVLYDSTNTTLTPSSLWEPADLREALWGLRPETLNDFQGRNASAALLSTFDLPPSVTIMPEAVADSFRLQVLGGNDHFKWFYQRYPEAAGVFTLSRPGLSPDGSQALIEMGWTKRGSYGHGTLLLLSCSDGTWVLADSVGTWVS